MQTEPEAIARDIVVALLSEGNAALVSKLLDTENATAVGEAVGSVYRAVLEAVKGGASEPESPATGSPPRRAGGDLAGTFPNPTIAPGVIGTENFAILPAVRAHRINSDQAIPHDSDTPVIYNSTDYDTSGMFPDTFSGDSRFTATVAGLYLVRASVRWVTNQTGERVLKIRKNGGFLEYSQEINPDTGHATTHFIAVVVDMRVADFIEAVVRQTSGGSSDIELGIGTDFTMNWLGPLPG